MIERVYLDTNALRGSWPGAVANQLRMVATLARVVGAQVCIPQSVVTEFRQRSRLFLIGALMVAGKKLQK
jgi:rRNA-processing protein FCF1